jgi:hypothetical protein
MGVASVRKVFPFLISTTRLLPSVPLRLNIMLLSPTTPVLNSNKRGQKPEELSGLYHIQTEK